MQRTWRFPGFLAVVMVLAFTGIAAGTDGSTVELGVDDQGMPEALARGEAIAIGPPPLEGLLGRPLVLEYQ